jgi:hypothetical protein
MKFLVIQSPESTYFGLVLHALQKENLALFRSETSEWL